MIIGEDQMHIDYLQRTVGERDIMKTDIREFHMAEPVVPEVFIRILQARAYIAAVQSLDRFLRFRKDLYGHRLRSQHAGQKKRNNG